MRSFRKTLILLLVLCIMSGLVGCQNNSSPSQSDSTSVPSSESESSSESVANTESSNVTPEPSATAEYEINGVSFNIDAPAEWTIGPDGIYKEYHMVDILGFEAISDTNNPFQVYDERYSDAILVREYTTSNYTAKYYHLQEETDYGKNNELVYCMKVDDKMVQLVFYPSFGTGGIGTQREEFELVLDTIEFFI